MIQIYQIGDTAVKTHGQKMHGWGVSGSGKSSTGFRSPTTFWTNRQYLPENNKVTISAQLIIEPGKTPRQKIERLKRLVDTPTTIIAYDIIDCEGSCACGCQSLGDGEMLWLSNSGILKSIDEEDGHEIRMSVELGAYWQPLNRYLWQWQDGEFDPFYPPLTQLPYASFIQRYPSRDVLLYNAFPGQWSRRPGLSRITAYDPALWALLPNNTGLRTPIGMASDFGGHSHTVHGDLGEWSAPPLSIYAFKDLPNVNSITLTINKNIGGELMTETLLFNMDVIHAGLLADGYTGLLTTDILYIGDVQPKPGFIVRGGAVLPSYPKIVYRGLWPGQLEPGTNFVSINKPLTSIQFAYNHTFRKL